MKTNVLHDLIHGAENVNGEPLDVAIVGRDGDKFNVFRIDEIYVDTEHGLVNIVFDQSKEVK